MNWYGTGTSEWFLMYRTREADSFCFTLPKLNASADIDTTVDMAVPWHFRIAVLPPMAVNTNSSDVKVPTACGVYVSLMSSFPPGGIRPFIGAMVKTPSCSTLPRRPLNVAGTREWLESRRYVSRVCPTTISPKSIAFCSRLMNGYFPIPVTFMHAILFPSSRHTADATKTEASCGWNVPSNDIDSPGSRWPSAGLMVNGRSRFHAKSSPTSPVFLMANFWWPVSLDAT